MKHFWVNNKKLRVFNDAHSARQVFAFSRVCNFISGAAAELQTWTGQTLPEFGKISFAEPLTDNMCQFTIYRENQTQLLAKQIKARITSSMLRGGLWKVEVFLDAKEDRGASCSVWTLGLTSF